MNEPVCPNCHATLEADLVASTGSAECPFCGTEVPQLEVSELITENVSSPSRVLAPSIAEIPAKSKIQVISAESERLVIYIPAEGSKSTRGLGAFALIWNVFVIGFSFVFLFAAGGNDDIPLLFIVPFFSLFWLVGLIVLYIWIRMRFTRTYLLLEPDRLSIQRILFGRKSIAKTYLGEPGRAELVESYRENDRPVYAVAVQGTNRTAKFGTALSQDEKDWLLETINRFLGVSPSDPTAAVPVPETCATCGVALTATAWSNGRVTCPQCNAVITRQDLAEPLVPPDDTITELAPEDLPEDSPIHITESGADELRFWLGAIPSGGVRTFVIVFATLFSLIWCGVTVGSVWVAFQAAKADFGAVELVVGIIGALMSVVPIVVGVAIARCRISVTVTPERLACRWHAGPLGRQKRLTLESITSVRLSSGLKARTQPGRVAGSNIPRQPSSNAFRVCTVYSETGMVPLTSFHQIGTARQVGGLVRYQLRRFGRPLPD